MNDCRRNSRQPPAPYNAAASRALRSQLHGLMSAETLTALGPWPTFPSDMPPPGVEVPFTGLMRSFKGPNNAL